ncbi:hypothetical protein TGVEG_290590 [Toxoplasma gondii VEG]|uniref:Polynucleotide adenylyltransferase n=2 Tax=Toxoplasma gondii TaxID=5811 RepID=V4ZFE3_TOXGV|nr:hypothetical protein TGVEG_290590 [Toxoplasma gondii VEG]KFG27849.1 hypothetical protein TGP89_290590 [Toxoplasma gondii p89]CEL76014.1 TPA: hypothetical protein BN1205_084000 [Toxoplasma gondii VEG]
MGLLTCHDLVSSTLQHAAGTQATTLIGTCCCCCCCRNVRTSTPFKFQQIFCAALDLLQREATTALSCDPDGSILAEYAASRSVSSYAVSHPYLVKLPHSMGGGNAEERNSLYGHNGMHGSALPLSESQQLHLDKKLLLSQDRASQLSQELLRQTNVEHASKANEMPVTSANQDNSSGRVLYGKQTGGRGGKRLQSWHDVLFLINWDLNDVAVCNLLHLFSRSNPVKQVLRRCFSVSVDRFLFALLRRVLTVPTPACFHGKQAGEQNGFSGSVQVTNPSFRPPVTLPHTSEKEAFQLDLVRCCLSSFCHLLFRTWASLAMTLEDPAPLLSKSRNSTRSHQEDSLGNEGSSRFCCACCVCSRAALTQRLFCSIHSHGGRALWNVVSKSPGLGGHCFFPRSIKASEEVSGVFLGMKSLLLPGLLMVWRDPRFPYVFPTEFLQSFDSLIHYTHREELHILRRQQRQATARFLNSQTWSSSGNTAAGAYGGTEMIGCSTTLKLGVMSLFLQAEHALKRGDIENMEKALGGEQHECADGKAAGVASATNDMRYLDLAKSITSSVAEALRPFHAAMLLRRFGPSRLPRRLYSEPAKVISEELGAILHEEYEVSGHLNEARDAATDFVANVCRWLWGSRMETNETRREQDRPHERFKAQEGSNRKDTLPCPEDDESGVWVWQFGSCVNGFSTRVSDVDICVLLAGNAAQLRGGSSGFAERGTRTPDEVDVQKHLHEIMLSWHGHDTEYGQAEKAVRLLGEVLERIKIAQNFDEDFESQDEQGKAGSVGQTPASEEPSDDKDAWQPRLKMDGIEIVPHARVPICRIDFLYGTFARTPSSTGQDSWSWQHVKTEVSFSNRLAILNSRYICRLAAQTPLSFTLAAAVKVWAQRRGLANAYRGYFSSYTWLLMAFHFLACREQPLIHNLLSPLPRMLKRVIAAGVKMHFQMR